MVWWLNKRLKYRVSHPLAWFNVQGFRPNIKKSLLPNFHNSITRTPVIKNPVSQLFFFNRSKSLQPKVLFERRSLKSYSIAKRAIFDVLPRLIEPQAPEDGIDQLPRICSLIATKNTPIVLRYLLQIRSNIRIKLGPGTIGPDRPSYELDRPADRPADRPKYS